MSLELEGISKLTSLGSAGAVRSDDRSTPAALDTASFRSLLERLEALEATPAAGRAESETTTGLEDFARAMQNVERDHAMMQQMREQLLEAWRSRTS